MSRHLTFCRWKWCVRRFNYWSASSAVSVGKPWVSKRLLTLLATLFFLQAVWLTLFSDTHQTLQRLRMALINNVVRVTGSHSFHVAFTHLPPATPMPYLLARVSQAWVFCTCVRKIVQKLPKTFVTCVWPSAWNISAPTERIFMTFDIRGFFFQERPEKIQVSLNSIRNYEYFTCRPVCIMTVSRSILPRMRNVSDKSCRENQNTHFVFSNFFSPRKSYRLWDNVEKYGRAGQTTDRSWALFAVFVLRNIPTNTCQ